jgi:hypothetical protein
MKEKARRLVARGEKVAFVLVRPARIHGDEPTFLQLELQSYFRELEEDGGCCFKIAPSPVNLFEAGGKLAWLGIQECQCWQYRLSSDRQN